MAVAATVLAALAPASGGPGGADAGLHAYRWGFLTCALVFVPGILVALRIRDDDAAETRGLAPAAEVAAEPA